MKKNDFITAYQHISFEKFDKEGNIKKCNFVTEWLNDENIKKYNDVDIYPRNDLCPTDIYNLWSLFDMELITDWTTDDVSLQFILNHIKILCGNELNVYDYFIKWLAQMVQYPDVKTNCPVLISKQGAGKGTLIRLLEKMFGTSKIFQTCNPSRDVWGSFNSMMTNAFFVNIDELSKKETIESEGRIKNILTEPVMTINGKGITPYDIKSFHRFLITTNSEDPINTSADDRRTWMIRCSDELIGNKEYFEKFYQIIDDNNAIKTFYEYLKSITGMDKFNKLTMPVTEYHKEMVEDQKKPILVWLEYFVGVNSSHEIIERKITPLTEEFNSWLSDNGFEYSYNAIKLGQALRLLNIDGVGKRKSNGALYTTFDITKLKKHFGIGCLLK